MSIQYLFLLARAQLVLRSFTQDGVSLETIATKSSSTFSVIPLGQQFNWFCEMYKILARDPGMLTETASQTTIQTLFADGVQDSQLLTLSLSTAIWNRPQSHAALFVWLAAHVDLPQVASTREMKNWKFMDM